jgi:hypothetical protein
MLAQVVDRYVSMRGYGEGGVTVLAVEYKYYYI